MTQDMRHRCVFCGAPENIIWVHGHGQCAHCKTNSFPCCDGDECIGGVDTVSVNPQQDNNLSGEKDS